MIKKTIEDILLEAGTINSQQLSECQKEFKKNGTSIENCLVEKKFITAEQLAKAYAEYASYDYIDQITEKMADLTLIGRFPLQFLRDNTIIPIKKDGAITIVTANPLNFQPVDELTSLIGGDVLYAVAPASTILEAINRYYPLEGSKQMIEELEDEDKDIAESVALEGIEEKDILTMATEAPIIKLVNQILYQAVKRGASDIHIEPFEKDVRVRYRIDGVMQDTMTIPKRIQGALISRIKIAIQSALTGHLVLSTLHTNDAPSSITRLIDMGIEPFLIASSVVIAMAQRLVRKLCDKCKKVYTPPEEMIKRLGLTPEEAKGITFYEANPEGCDECSHTGYKGRLAIFEVMEMTDDIERLTMERADTTQIRKQAVADGMTLLLQDGIRKIKEGITTIEEVLAVATIEI